MWGQTAHGGTVHGQTGRSGAPVRGPAEWVSSRGSEPSSVPGPTAPGVRTSWEETWSIASVTSSPAEVSQPSCGPLMTPHPQISATHSAFFLLYKLVISNQFVIT